MDETVRNGEGAVIAGMKRGPGRPRKIEETTTVAALQMGTLKSADEYEQVEVKPVPGIEPLIDYAAQLAIADRTITRLIDLAAELTGRLYCIEMAMGIRTNGSPKIDALRYTGGATRATLEMVKEQTKTQLAG